MPESEPFLARIAASASALAAWLFVSRIAHAAAPSIRWWSGSALALLLLFAALVIAREAPVSRADRYLRWLGLIVPVLVAALLYLGAPRPLTAGACALAAVAATGAVLSWTRAPGRRATWPGRILDPFTAGAALLAGIVPAAAAPVITAIALALIVASVLRRMVQGRFPGAQTVFGLLVPGLVFAGGLVWPALALGWLAGAMCALGLALGED